MTGLSVLRALALGEIAHVVIKVGASLPMSGSEGESWV